MTHSEVIAYITNHGYLAVFLLVFAQEIGIPLPVPNELVLMFAGYLTYKGILYLPLVLLTVFSADFIGTNLLFILFYFLGDYILQHKPRWLPVSVKTIDKLTARISKGGRWTIYVGRLSPVIRGYTAVIAGLLHIKPRIFLPIAVITAIIWSVVYILAGRILGPYWNHAEGKVGTLKLIVLIAVLIILIITVIGYYRKPSTEESGE